MGGLLAKCAPISSLPSNEDRKNSGDEEQEAACVSVACYKGLQRAHYSQLDNNEGNQELNKSTEEVWAGWIPIGCVKCGQRIPERVPRPAGVVVVSQQARGRKVSDKDRKVEECSNELEGVTQETDSQNGEKRDQDGEDRL